MKMTAWPDRRVIDLFGIRLPIIQAPMSGAVTPALAAAVSAAGGLGSLPLGVLRPDEGRLALSAFRQLTSKPVSLNFFCHAPTAIDPACMAAWTRLLRPYYVELGLDPEVPVSSVTIAPFGREQCDLVEALKPEVVSFHFGLPERGLLRRVKQTGAKILSSATTVAEALWLEENGCDAIIAQGAEAGGHRGMFLSDDVAAQIGTLALVPQVADAVKVPVIAAGGIADGRGIAACFALGASAVQIGTAYLFCPEASLTPLHRQALLAAQDDQTVITNVFTGRPARVIANRIVRELGLIVRDAPAFPLTTASVALLRSKTEPGGSGDFVPLWCGQAAHLCREFPAGQLTRQLAEEALVRLSARRPNTDIRDVSAVRAQETGEVR